MAHFSQDFPVIFHGVTGIDEREASSPSFFNRAEVEVLMDYVKKLLQTQAKKGLATIAPRDIGIIAPYRKQVRMNCHPLNTHFVFISRLKVGAVVLVSHRCRKSVRPWKKLGKTSNVQTWTS